MKKCPSRFCGGTKGAFEPGKLGRHSGYPEWRRGRGRGRGRGC